MSNLPPYSTFRTDSKQMLFPQATSHGNMLSFVPPGFKHKLNVKFPDSRLAVCEKCKKNFKTRDMCRVRNTHATAPWTTAYICITVDDSCLDEDGKYVDKPLTVRMVQWQPYCVKKPFGPKTPVCAACKRTNRTRSFCRERHKHRHLPWCTVYVLLSSVESADPSTIVAAPSKLLDESSENGASDGVESGSKLKQESGEKDTDDKSITGADTISSDNGDEGDDINDIPESRTFLAKVSCRSTSIHWLELSDYDASESAQFPGALPPDPAMYHMPPVPGIDHPTMSFYNNTMGYAAQQHQNALKSRQQYFFQMQQHHQQQYSVSPQQHTWQHHPYNPDQPHMGPTAGEAAAAAAQQRRSHEEMTAHQQPWAMYYPPPPHYSPLPAAHHHPAHDHPLHDAHGGGHHYGHSPPDSDGEEPDVKRPRI